MAKIYAYFYNMAEAGKVVQKLKEQGYKAYLDAVDHFNYEFSSESDLIRKGEALCISRLNGRGSSYGQVSDHANIRLIINFSENGREDLKKMLVDLGGEV
ncbi:MAG: hypothetical protein N2645_04265 [Clostridia bacterium]|nr:hypothetical protein [Clostridia bacterium]